MSEIKKLTIVGIVLSILFGISILIYALDKSGKFNNSVPSKDEYKIYYLGREGCGFCQMFEPNIENIKKNYNIDYEYIDIEKISSTELNNYFEKFNITEDDKFGTPTIAIMKNGDFLAKNIGYLSEQKLYEFLKKYGVITGSYISEYKNLTYIDLDEYKEIVNSSDKKLVVIAQEDCDNCDKTQEYLNTLAQTQNLKVYYYNVSFETEEDYNYFYNSYEFIKESLDDDKLYTPTFMIVENKKVIDHLSLFESEEALNNLLKKNGLIK